MPEDNDVGYKKPPKHNRFKKGQSGNPKGRPKDRKSFATRFFAILNEPVTLREGEKVPRLKRPSLNPARLSVPAASSASWSIRSRPETVLR